MLPKYPTFADDKFKVPFRGTFLELGVEHNTCEQDWKNI